MPSEESYRIVRYIAESAAAETPVSAGEGQAQAKEFNGPAEPSAGMKCKVCNHTKDDNNAHFDISTPPFTKGSKAHQFQPREALPSDNPFLNRSPELGLPPKATPPAPDLREAQFLDKLDNLIRDWRAALAGKGN